MDDYEGRARRAGHALAGSVRSLEPGVPPLPRPRIRPSVVVAAIAVLAVVVVGLYARRDDHRVDISDSKPFDVNAVRRHFAPRSVPDGLVLTARRDVACAAPAPGATAHEGNDPPGSPLLCHDEVWYMSYESLDRTRFVSITRERRSAPPERTAVEIAVAVRGHPGHFSTLTQNFARLYWPEDEQTTIVINATGLSQVEMLGIAEDLGPLSAEQWNALAATPLPFDATRLVKPDVSDDGVLIRFLLPSGEEAQLRESPDRLLLCVALNGQKMGCGSGDRIGFDTRPPWPRYAGGGGTSGTPSADWTHYRWDLPVGFPTEFSVRTVNGRALPSGRSDDGRFLLVIDPDMADRDLLEVVDPDGDVITRLYAAGRDRSEPSSPAPPSTR